MSGTITVALVGNPNCGKTTLYNKLTGAKDSVGNYPRVTVEQNDRTIEHKGWTLRMVDLPGIYSMTSQSPEERIGRDFIQDERPDIVLNVLDAGALERSLFLTTQLIEMGRPRLYALNMVDEARRKGHRIKSEALASMLGGPVVETVATRGEGVDAVLDAVVAVAESAHKPDEDEHQLHIPYDAHLEESIERARKLVADLHPGALEQIQSRWLAIKLLEGDDEILRREGEHTHLVELVRRERYDLAHTHDEEAEIMFADARYGFINGLLAEAREVEEDPAFRLGLSRRIDDFILHRTFGLPIFLAAMWLMFETTFTLGNLPAGWIDSGVGVFSDFVANAMSEGMLRSLLVDGVIAGMGAIIVFLPYIVILFFFIALFSETGYLARTAFLVDRAMHSFGLHGKAFIPLVMGFGCNVPAVMATRTIESERSRLIAILINPFISCSQRLPAFLLFSGAFFADMAGTVLFAIYLTSIGVAMGAAVLLSRFVIRGGTEAFVMELPPYRLPTIHTVLFHMWERAWDFIRMVGGVILVGSVVIWFLQAFPTKVDFSKPFEAEIAQLEAQPESEARDQAITDLKREMGREQVEKSYLGQVGQAVAPVFAAQGFDWRDTVAIITGFFAKEVVVASYAVLYAQDEGHGGEGSASLRNAISQAMTPLTAFALMVFILLYSPCMSTLAVIKREAGSWGWAGFSLAFSFAIAWVLAFGVVAIGGLIA